MIIASSGLSCWRVSARLGCGQAAIGVAKSAAASHTIGGGSGVAVCVGGTLDMAGILLDKAWATGKKQGQQERVVDVELST